MIRFGNYKDLKIVRRRVEMQIRRKVCTLLLILVDIDSSVDYSAVKMRFVISRWIVAVSKT